MFLDLCVTLLLELFLEEFLELDCQSGVRLLLKLLGNLGQKVQSGFNDKVYGSRWYSSVGAFDRSQLSICIIEECGMLFYADGFRANSRPNGSHGCHDAFL